MIVVSDTTPINHLILVNKIVVLHKLLGRIIIPTAVFRELQADKTPEIVKGFIKTSPAWLEIRQPQFLFDEDLNNLDTGEREAIILADAKRKINKN